MTFLPIVERELRAAVRKKVTYIVRLLGTVVALLLAFWLLLTMTQRSVPASVGAKLFSFLTNLAFAGCSLAGVLLTADCISEEKREGTIGFLFLTPLRSYDIVAGKLIGSSLNTVYALIAILPVLAISLVLGGVTLGEVARMSLVLLNTLFLSVATGLWVSSMSRHSQRAMAGTATLIITVTYIFARVPYLAWVSPWMLFHAAFDAQFGPAPHIFFVGLIGQHAVGWVLLLCASVFTGRTWRESPAFQLSGERSSIWNSLPHGRRQRRPPLGDHAPAYWLADRGRPVVWVWSSLLLITALWVGTQPWTRRLAPQTFLIISAYAQITIEFWVAWEAARRFNEDRRSRALELLLSTPLSPADLARAHWLSLWEQFAGPVVTVLLGDLGLTLFAFAKADWPGEALAEFMTLKVAMTFLFVVNSLALAWTSLWLGLASRNTSRATLGALLRIIVIPTAIFMIAILFIWSTRIAAAGGAAGPAITAATWVLVSGVCSYLFYEQSRKRLLSEQCRQLACQSAVPFITFADEPEPAAMDYSQPYALLR